MKARTFIEVLGLTVIGVIVFDLVSPKSNTASIIESFGESWGNILRVIAGNEPKKVRKR